MACDKIMLIRHSERPDREKGIRGVGPDGQKDKESISVRGWQRAGALVRFFAPLDGRFGNPALARPAALYACKADASDPSLRPQMTLVPLAELLKLEINGDFFDGEEEALVEKALRSPGPALISWKHIGMHLIANAILGDKMTAPQHWPYERYDFVWIFDRRGDNWAFSQIPELLLAGDSSTPIV